MNSKLCPCGSGQSFSACCEPYINQSKQCPNAESLMRSRYSAFALGFAEYLLFTSSSHLKNQLSKEALNETINAFEFVKLDVIDTSDNTVSFNAHLIDGNEHHQLKEVSTFIKEDGLWKYDTGVLEQIPVIKLSRNDQCPCGSGKKFKKCHMS